MAQRLVLRRRLSTIQIEKYLSSLVEYSKPCHFHDGVGEVGRVGDCRFVRKSVKIKEELPLFPIFIKSLITEELDLFQLHHLLKTLSFTRWRYRLIAGLKVVTSFHGYNVNKPVNRKKSIHATNQP